ncbi:MAG: Metallopeptidase, partial [uncultured Sphingomonadaceae bacterium]
GMVDARRHHRLQRARRQTRRAVRCLRAAPGPSRPGQADHGRECRGPRRPHRRLRGLQGIARRAGGDRDRRRDRRPAFLPRHGADLAAQLPQGEPAAAAVHRLAFVVRAARRPGPQLGSLVRRLPGPARPAPPPRAHRSGKDLV